MSQSLDDITPDIQHLITEDEAPARNLPSEKQQRLLIEPLYSSWAGPGEGRTFLAAANVGIFAMARNPAMVPDMFLSLDVQVVKDWWQKEHRSYFVWEFGHPPHLVLEIVSNTEGDEDGEKKRQYAWPRISYYVIYDPLQQVMPDVLTVGIAQRLRGLRIHPHRHLRAAGWGGGGRSRRGRGGWRARAPSWERVRGGRHRLRRRGAHRHLRVAGGASWG